MENNEFASADIIEALHKIGTQLIDTEGGAVAVVQCKVNPELSADFSMEVDVFPDFGSAFMSIRMELWPVERPDFNALVFSVEAQWELEEMGLPLPQLPLWAGHTEEDIHPRFNKFKMCTIPDSLYGIRHMRGARG
ncbi:hypothetical protein GCM10010385_58330 [Streptomyces geysiriensis]|uniref:hypothetical protein n=1 Tax=Streptomyces rochei TaxID=1928 RepID=UPI0017857762|nr:hypothetical protein GCM10010385_58330 [Streptomyces geysiriensis]